jgi:hypothetical protein
MNRNNFLWTDSHCFVINITLWINHATKHILQFNYSHSEWFQSSGDTLKRKLRPYEASISANTSCHRINPWLLQWSIDGNRILDRSWYTTQCFRLEDPLCSWSARSGNLAWDSSGAHWNHVMFQCKQDWQRWDLLATSLRWMIIHKTTSRQGSVDPRASCGCPSARIRLHTRFTCFNHL